MGIIKGSLTFFRLGYQNEFNLSITEIAEKLKEYSFENLYDEFRTVNYGFTPFLYPTAENFDETEIFFNEYMLFTVRIDEKKINSNFFNIELEKKKKELLSQSNKEKLTKSDIDFLKNSVTKTLLNSTTPSTTIVEVILDSNNNFVYINKLNSKIFDALSHLFRIAFDINLYRESFAEILKRNLRDLSILDNLLNSLPTTI